MHAAVVEVVLDGSSIKGAGDVHRLLSDAFDFGPYYGRNLAALRDRLLTDVPRPVHVRWTHSDEARRRLGDDFDRVAEVFAEAAEQDERFGWQDRFTFSME